MTKIKKSFSFKLVSIKESIERIIKEAIRIDHNGRSVQCSEVQLVVVVVVVLNDCCPIHFLFSSPLFPLNLPH